MNQKRRTFPVEIFDVTIRDGSYTIDFQFNKNDVRFLYGQLERIGFRYIEVGHGFGLNASSVKGMAAASDEEYLSAAAETRKNSKFGTFFIPSIANKEHMRRAREEFGMDFIRIGSDANIIDGTAPFVEYAKSLGYEVMSNFMKSYMIPPAEFAKKAKLLADAGTDVVYVVDSAGSMLPEEVAEYVKAVANETDVRIGFHAHNNLELAAANAVAAWREGCTLVDCSIGGLGRSAGNTRTEIFIPIMKQYNVRFDYDFLEVLRIWQEFILPIQRRRKPSAQGIVGGYARVHSGMVGPFKDAAKKRRISLDALLDAYGDALYAGNPNPSIDEIAAQVEPPKSAKSPSSESVLLQIDHSQESPDSIRNTYHSVEEVLTAVHALSKKAYVPVALVVSIDPVPADEPYVMAEYLYHDERFIVIRAMFSSVSLFAEMKQKHAGEFNILVFDRLSASNQDALELCKTQWFRGESLVHLDCRITKYHYLFSNLYQLATETRAKTALLFAGDPEAVRLHAPPEMRPVKFYCACQKSDSLTGVGIFELDLFQTGEPMAASPKNVLFDIVLLLSPVGGVELESIVGRMRRDGVIMDCVAECDRHGAILNGIPQRIVRLNTWKAISGELLHLLGASKEHGDDGGI